MGLKWGDDFFKRNDKKDCLFCRPGQSCSWCKAPGWRTESWGYFGGVEQKDPAPAPPEIPLQKEPWPLPKPSQGVIFAKSCSPGNWCCTEAGTTTEPAAHFGKVMVAKTKAIPAGAAALGATLGADAALGRIAGGGIIQQGFRWMLRSAMVAGGGATVFIAGMLPARMGDGTLYSDDELRQMTAAASRVRFQFRHDAEGVLQLYGIHASGSGDDSVRIVKAQWRADGRTLEAHLGDGITLLWTPNSGPLLTPELTFPEHTDEPMGSILVHPIEEGVDSQIDGYPVADDVTLGDRIITFPLDSGLRSIYVVFSKPFGGDHSYYPPPKELVAFPDAVRDKLKSSVQGGGKKRRRWKDRKGRIYEWDSRHGAVEMYDRQGNHLGEFNSETGEQTKPAKPGRKIEK
ncbi:colicin E3/pyocin S6 family cytotoxin [Pseudomonas batumici]|uniref:Uropathogenic specific protein n=1 Tax=Pseudomonas batumici TaxID=226910 RepID=A0A0C2IG47_9PSED|nr:colicin E3/pyocin S6 family cytotoxin [Pseudomonas batumici]KIH83882.1 Uropathogenic specific protein [Pseudomonas batumici]